MGQTELLKLLQSPEGKYYLLLCNYLLKSKNVTAEGEPEVPTNVTMEMVMEVGEKILSLTDEKKLNIEEKKKSQIQFLMLEIEQTSRLQSHALKPKQIEIIKKNLDAKNVWGLAEAWQAGKKFPGIGTDTMDSFFFAGQIEKSDNVLDLIEQASTLPIEQVFSTEIAFLTKPIKRDFGTLLNRKIIESGMKYNWQFYNFHFNPPQGIGGKNVSEIAYHFSENDVWIYLIPLSVIKHAERLAPIN